MGEKNPAENISLNQEVFSGILAAKPTPQKPTLAERCQFETLSALIKYVTSNGCILEVNPRNFVPAYVTRLETKADVLGGRYPINVYHHKNEPPQQPRADEPSTVRFDAFPSLHLVFNLLKLISRQQTHQSFR